MAARLSQTPSLGQQNKSTGGRPLIILLLLSIVLLTASFRTSNGGVIAGAKSVFQTLAMPVRMAGSAILAPFEGLGNVFSNLTSSQETLSELREENERLRARNVELEEAQLETLRLQELLDIKSSYELTAVAARIISGSTDSWTSTLMLDRGSVSGVTVGMPVVDATGVIGQIIECGPTTSVVRLLMDENSSIAAMVQNSRAQGMLEGSAQGQLFLNLISTEIPIEVGQTVVTSGLDGVYPKGLPLGRITGVDQVSGSLTYDISVEPFSSTRNYEEVLIVCELSAAQVADEDDVLEADNQERGNYTAADESAKADANTDSSDSEDQG